MWKNLVKNSAVILIICLIGLGIVGVSQGKEINTISSSAEVTSPFYYKVFGDGDFSSTTSQVDDSGYAYVQFDSIDPAYVYGNIKVTYTLPGGVSEDAVECISIEETPISSGAWGFWPWWTLATANPTYGGGGILYTYADNDGNPVGGEWAQEWVNDGYGSGMPGSIDTVNNNIFMYASTYAGGYAGSVPLRFGFRINSQVPVTVNFEATNNSKTSYDWNNLTNSYTSSITFVPPVPPLPVQYIKIEGDSDIAMIPDETREFIAVGYHKGDDGERNTADDVRLNEVEATWTIAGSRSQSVFEIVGDDITTRVNIQFNDPGNSGTARRVLRAVYQESTTFVDTTQVKGTNEFVIEFLQGNPNNTDININRGENFAISVGGKVSPGGVDTIEIYMEFVDIDDNTVVTIKIGEVHPDENDIVSKKIFSINKQHWTGTENATRIKFYWTLPNSSAKIYDMKPNGPWNIAPSVH